jgi:hypothetical protein
MSIGTGIREASAFTPARNPPWVRTGGRMPWTSSRSSAVALLGVVERLGQQGGEVLLLVLQGALCQLERDDCVDEPLLGAVV